MKAKSKNKQQKTNKKTHHYISISISFQQISLKERPDVFSIEKPSAVLGSLNPVERSGTRKGISLPPCDCY
jgi:hypothetical protein